MTDLTRSMTSTSLLDGLSDPANDAVWRAFDERYRPVILALGQRMGLTHADAADAVQEALLQFVRDYRLGRYERGKGRLRHWLQGIARHRIADALRARGRQREQAKALKLEDPAAPDEMSRLWDEESEREIMRQAMAELRETSRTTPRNIEAFEALVFGGRPVPAVAEEFGLTAHDVYMIKHRTTAKLREIVERLTAEWNEDL
jgi:RNA polymerase sigma factor (sigma-70 family)